MELELGDKMVKRTRDNDEDDESEVLKEKEDQVLWYCSETPSMFILSLHLQGYKRNSIEIVNIKEEEGRDQTPTNINEDKQLIQKLVIMGEVIMRKITEEEILRFTKVFKIPSGVFLDQIKAKYSEEESVLKICMPKFVKQICGDQIEEIKEEEEEEFGESSHKVIKEFKVVYVFENPNNRVLEIRNKYGESDGGGGDDEREDDGKEETDEAEVKNSEEKQNVGEESQEVVSNRNIVIQSSEENDNSVLGMEEEDQTIGGRKEKENEDTIEERVDEDISKEERIEGRKLKETEDRDIEVKEGTKLESIQMMKTSYNTFVERVEEEFENIKGGSDNEIGEIGYKEGFEEGVKKKEVKDLLIEDPNNNRVLEMISIEYKGHEIEVEVLDEHEQREGVYVEISKEVIDNELMEDIQVEAREDDRELRDEVYMKISQVEERRESQFKENDEEKKKFHGPMFVAGSALFVVSLVVFFVRHTRVEKKE